MTGRKNQKYDSEFKYKIVMLLLKNEASSAELCRRYNLASSVVHRWRQQFLEAGLQGLKKPSQAAGPKAIIEDLKEEVTKRDQIIGELTVANQLLKKSAYNL